MTAPTEPTPGAPADPAQPLQPAVDPQASTEDIASLPEWAQKQIRDARAEAAKSRTTAKQTAAEEARQQTLAQVAKALGLGDSDEPLTADEVASQIEAAQGAAWQAGVELNVYRLAPTLGANADALLDSLKFIDSLQDLVDEDPRSPEFATALTAKVQAALDANPNLRTAGQAPAAPRPDPSQGSRGTPPARFSGSLTDALKAHYGQQ